MAVLVNVILMIVKANNNNYGLLRLSLDKDLSTLCIILGDGGGGRGYII